MSEYLGYTHIVADLRGGLRTDPYSRTFSAVRLPSGWQEVQEPHKDFTDPYKVTAINQQEGIFAKAYAPTTEDFSFRVFNAMLTLGDLDLAQPVLTPLDHTDKTLVFPLGRDIGDLPFHRLAADDRVMLDEIARWQGLRPLFVTDVVRLVEVDGITYMTDVVEDSGSSIQIYKMKRDQGMEVPTY